MAQEGPTPVLRIPWIRGGKGEEEKEGKEQKDGEGCKLGVVHKRKKKEKKKKVAVVGLLPGVDGQRVDVDGAAGG